MEILASKPCSMCDVEKPLTDYRPRQDGHEARCRACANARKRETYRSSSETWLRGERLRVAGVKVCGKCNTTKPETEFYKRSGRPGKTQSACKKCAHAYSAKQYAADPEARAANVRAWQAANPERVLENSRRYARENPALRVAIKHRRRTIVAGSPRLAVHLIAARVAYFGGKCWMCGEASDTLDHVKPLAKGGPNILANLRPACRSCNSRKHAKWYGPAELHRFLA